MKIPFEKYQGTGNDFVVIDNRQRAFPADDLNLITAICNRNTGVGSDGLILIGLKDGVDFTMTFFNPDGSKSLCGNGSRCAVSYARELGIAQTDGRMETTDGLHKYKIRTDGTVAISMHDISEWSTQLGHSFINTGSPHLMVDVGNSEVTDVVGDGRKLRNNAVFQSINGANINFVAATDSDDTFNVRTYERGVEAETLSCGTGVTAVALSKALNGFSGNEVFLNTRGGRLSVRFRKEGGVFRDIWLIGPAKHVFSGVYHA